MNVGPLGGVPVGGVLSSAAGSQLQQTHGKDTDRASQEVSSQQRGDKLGDHADMAAGVGQTEEDQGTSERDADGRKMWEGPPQDNSQEQQQNDEQHSEQQEHQPKDPTGEAGNALDLTG
jgi:hypothetical protein